MDPTQSDASLAKVETILNEVKPARTAFEEVSLSFVGGCIAGVSNVLSGHPFDTLKVRMQMLGVGFTAGIRSMIKNEGIFSPFKGVASPLYNVPLIYAIYFGSYELARWLQGVGFNEKMNLTQTFLAGAFSGLPGCFIITPVELVKCKLQMEGVGERIRTTTTFQMAKNIYKQEGLRGLFRGNLITLLREVPSGAFFFTAYEMSKDYFEGIYGHNDFIPFISGGIAGLVMTVVSYPQDVIKTKIQCALGSNPPLYTNHRYLKDGGIINCMKQMWKTDGMSGFWRGFSASAVRGIFSEAVTFVAYLEGKKLLAP